MRHELATAFWILVFVGMVVVGMLLLLGCAPTKPYAANELERRITPLAWNWASTRGNILKEITCLNDTPVAVTYDVYCDGEKYPDKQLPVKAHDRASFFHDVDARYSIGEACTCEVVK